MIKLVLSDLDGTLLQKGEVCLKENLINIIKKFSEKNIKFAVASGRSYSELLEIFNNIRDIYYVCLDGTCVINNGEVLYKKNMDICAVRRFYDVKNVVFHSFDVSYYKNADDELKKLLYDKYKSKIKKAENNDDLKEILKISKYGAGFAELPPFSYEVYKDRKWCEWINNNSGKGKATEFLQKTLDIKISETAAFGDNFNDIGMLNRASHKYIMENSPSFVKSISNKRVQDIEKELYKILNEV